MFDKLFKAAVAVVVTPVAMVADVVTLGGAMINREEPFTATTVKAAAKNIGEAIE